MTRPLGNRTDAVGNGTTPDYDYSFIIEDEAHLLVTVRSPEGVESKLTLTTDYTVDGVGDVGGGQISLVDDGQTWLDDDGNLEDEWAITIRRVRPLTQETDIRNQGDFYPESHEDQFDALVEIDQQQQDEIDRSAKLPETVDPDTFDTNLPADIADNPDAAIVVNSDGNGLSMGPTTDQISYAQAYATAAGAAQTAAEAAQAAAEAAQAAAESAAGTMTLASQAEAEEGTNNTKYMSSLRVRQSLLRTAVALSVAANHVATNGALGSVFDVDADDDFTLDNPTNAYDGQKFVWRIKQDGTGSRILTLDSKFTVNSEISSVVLSTAASAIDHIGAIYNETDDKFEIVAFSSEQA